MRLLFIAAACALVAAGSASAQTKGFAPYSAPLGDTAQVQTGHDANTPGPAARPATMAGSSAGRPMAARPATRHAAMSHASMRRGAMHHRDRRHGAMHHGMRHHMGRHQRSHSAAWCMSRTKGRHSHARTHAIERCEAGRHHSRHGHHRHHGHHRMAAKK